MFAQEVARRCVSNFFTSLRFSRTRGMRSSLCGYEVCPVFAEQTTAPHEQRWQDIVCVCVYGSVLKNGVTGKLVMHLNY